MIDVYLLQDNAFMPGHINFCKFLLYVNWFAHVSYDVHWFTQVSYVLHSLVRVRLVCLTFIGSRTYLSHFSHVTGFALAVIEFTMSLSGRCLTHNIAMNRMSVWKIATTGTSEQPHLLGICELVFLFGTLLLYNYLITCEVLHVMNGRCSTHNTFKEYVLYEDQRRLYTHTMSVK